MAMQFEPSIVRICKSNGIVVGAGFLVQEKYILTCAHVVAQALGISEYTAEKPLEEVNLDFVILEPGEIFQARVVIWRQVQADNSLPPPEDGEDIAVLKLETAPPVGAIPAPLLSKKKLEGHGFAAFGFPDGHDNGVWAYGVLCRRQGAGWVQIEAEKEPGFRVEPGFSGTPIWDKKLKGIVGIAVAADLERIEAKVAFMIPTEMLVKAWSKLGEWTIPPLIPGKNRAKGSWYSSPKVWAGLVLVPVLSSTAFWLPQLIGESSCFYQARKQGKQAIAVAKKFHNSGTSFHLNPDLENKILESLEEQVLPDVKICPTDKIVSRSNEAQALGKKLGAAIIVWGTRGGSTLEVYVTAVKHDVSYLSKLSLPTANSFDLDLKTEEWPDLIPLMAAFNLSEIYKKEGKLQKAIDTLNLGIDLARTKIIRSENQQTIRVRSLAHYFLGFLYENTTNSDCSEMRENCEKALIEYKQALKWDPIFFEALINQGILYERLGKLPEAVKIYTQSIESAPNSSSNIDIRQYRADILLKQGKAKEAVEDLEFVCQGERKDIDCLHLLGLAQLQAGNISRATDIYQEIMRALNKDKIASSKVISDLEALAEEKPELASDIQQILSE